ncbi:hypothetical protein AWH66_2021010 [Vibrio barjaei]|jgi:signal transduction histidine kinase|nr:hypothetical protein AWH66_2021010 [Vibrio barjaei]
MPLLVTSAIRLVSLNKTHILFANIVALIVLHNVVVVASSSKHGTSFHDFKDSAGQSVADIILSKLGNTTGMLVEYSWPQKLPSGNIEDKLSIAKRTPHWNWVVGTRIGINEVNERF